MEPRIDILIPVLCRPRNVRPLVESIESNTTLPHRTLFIATQNDKEEIAALEEAGVEFLVHPEKAGKANFAKKINWAYERSDAEWLFQGADDIRFSENWDINALASAKSHGKPVVGTNDLHNPLVRRHKSSTHTLFARSYIEVYGGTSDGTGAVFCELYDHQYVDNEFIETAKRRNQFCFSPKSVVEHFHPHWGNAEMDATYTKATRSSGADRRLYALRMEQQKPGRQERIARRRALRATRR